MFSMEKFDLRPQQVIQKKMIIALQVMEPEKAGKPGAWGKTGGKLINMVVCQNLVPLVNIKIACKWMFIPLKMVCIGIDP